MIHQDLEERFDAAAEMLDAFLREIQSETGKPFGDLNEISFTRLMISLHPGIQEIVVSRSNSNGIYYVVDERAAAYLQGAAQDLPEAADVIEEICASNVFEGAAIPYSLRCAAFEMIKGTYPRAKRRGAKLTGDFFKRWLLRWAAIDISETFDLPLTRYDGVTTLSACDVVSLVVQRHRMNVSFNLLRDWCTHKDHREMRKRADSLTNFLKDAQLIEWGVLKARAPAYGAFLELALMRK